MNEKNNNLNVPQQPNGNPKKKKRFNMMWLYAVLFALLIGMQFFGRDETVQEEVDQGKLIEMLQNQEIAKIELVNKEDAEIYLNEKGLKKHFPEVQPVGGTTLKPN